MNLKKRLTGNGHKLSDGKDHKLSNGNGHNGSNGNGHLKIIDVQEKNADRKTAVKCIIYLLLMLALFGWLLFDTWIGKHSLASFMGYDLARLNNPGFTLVAFSIIAIFLRRDPTHQSVAYFHSSLGGLVELLLCEAYYHKSMPAPLAKKAAKVGWG